MSAQNRFQRTAVRQERNRLRDFQLLSQTSFFNKELRNINDAYLANWVLEWFSSHSLPIVQSFLSKRDGHYRLETRLFPPRNPEAGAGGAAVLACPAAPPSVRSCSGRPPASPPTLGLEPRPVFLESAGFEATHAFVY